MHGLCRDAPVTAPVIPDDYDLGFFNYITGYTMHALSCSQSMSMLQVIPGDGKTVRSIMSVRFPSIPADTTGTRLVSLHTVAYVQALGIHSCTYLAPPKPLAAKASSFANNLVQDATADADFSGFYDNVGLMLGNFYEDFMGLEGASGQRCGLSGKRRASKGTEFAKAAPARDPTQAEPAEAAAASGSNGADAEQAPTPPPTAEVEAGPALARARRCRDRRLKRPAAAPAHEK